MKVYDFDKTIYDGDSTVDFYLFCLKRNPHIFLCLPEQVGAIIRYKMGKITKTEMKEAFFSFLRKLKDTNCLIDDFWDKHRKKIKKFYETLHKEDDVIISASPRFLLEGICRQLDVKTLIASEVDIHTGHFYGENCYGEMKVTRFREIFGEQMIDAFYSDSKSDFPLAQIAREAFLVKGEQMISWK